MTWILLTDNMDYNITLYEDIPNKGRCTARSKDSGMYEHFDSYGNDLTNPLRGRICRRDEG